MNKFSLNLELFNTVNFFDKAKNLSIHLLIVFFEIISLIFVKISLYKIKNSFICTI